MQWFPYGERKSDDVARDAYVDRLLRLLKSLLDSSKAASLPLLKVRHLHWQACCRPM